MKTIKLLTLSILACLGLGSCQEAWDQHYQSQNMEIQDGVVVVQSSSCDYLQSNYSAMHNLLDAAGIFNAMNEQHDYSILVYPNALLEGSAYANDTAYASYCISDVACSPSELWSGMGITTWQGKTIWVDVKDGQNYMGGSLVSKVIKTNDAYLYIIEDQLLSVLPSVYDAIMALDDTQYSEFKKLVRRHERTYFDASKCTPIGTNAQGNTVYADSVKGWITENTLMDRYTQEGVEMWNMRSETYNNTVFVPSNDLIKAVIDTAMAKVPRWLGRKATAADRTKYENWLLRVCFVDRELSEAQVLGSEDINCVGGYTRDKEKDKYSVADMAMWRPTVQKVRTDDKIKANNGTLYFIDWMKVPNNVIIYRLKSRFYELWNNSTQEQKDQYFRWTHWIDPMVINDAQGSFTLSETLPTMYYHVLTAIPDKEARRDTLPCSVTYDGLLYLPSNPRGQQIVECCIPAGEYYLRMGFKHSLEYSLSIQFNDTMLIEDMIMCAQGSNYHFDRGSVSVVDNYGESSIGYPEGYNWHDWSSLSEKAQAYDTDGFQVGIVNVEKEGNFTITITSNDMSRLYDYNAQRNTSNVKQLMMYHWCLRPTKNNY